ncbi:MAG: hypothetical protein R2787_14695 [Saprospiraceae bacterium]
MPTIRNQIPPRPGSAQLAALTTKDPIAPEAEKVIFQSLDGSSAQQDISTGLPPTWPRPPSTPRW